MKPCWTGLRLAALSSLLLAALTGASCGGGGEPVERFVPTRLIVIGDETSVINKADGSKYTVNGLVSGTTTNALDCSANPIWVQVLASAYSLEFDECPSGVAPAPVTALIRAAAGEKVADVAAQIDAVGAFAGKDLATVLAGTNDVFEQYALFNTTVNGVVQTEAVLTANLEAAGEALAQQVNRIANAGGKVLIATLPDLGRTPFALAEEALNPGQGRAAMLSRLTDRFNAKLRVKIINDGRRIGLLLLDELSEGIVKNPAAYGFVNVTAAVCDPALAPVVTACNTNTLVSGGSATTYLWANDRLLSPGGHRQLGNLAITRASNNPF